MEMGLPQQAAPLIDPPILKLAAEKLGLVPFPLVVLTFSNNDNSRTWILSQLYRNSLKKP